MSSGFTSLANSAQIVGKRLPEPRAGLLGPHPVGLEGTGSVQGSTAQGLTHTGNQFSLDTFLGPGVGKQLGSFSFLLGLRDRVCSSPRADSKLRMLGC